MLEQEGLIGGINPLNMGSLIGWGWVRRGWLRRCLEKDSSNGLDWGDEDMMSFLGELVSLKGHTKYDDFRDV